MRGVAAAFCAALLCQAPSTAGAGTEAFLALQGSAPDSFNYVRLSEIQAFRDSGPDRCDVLMKIGPEIKAFQSCASLTAHLDRNGLVALPGPYGSVLLLPGFVTSLVSLASGGCRVNLLNGVWAPVTAACREALQAIAGE